MMENKPISKMPPIDLAFGVCILSFLHKAIVQITIPQTVKRVPANIKILGISVPLIQNAWYPIFIQGNNEPQSAITRRDKTMVLSLDSLLFIRASLMVFTILHQLERVIVQGFIYLLLRNTQSAQTRKARGQAPCLSRLRLFHQVP